MDREMKSSERVLQMFLKAVREAAVRGAGKPSYKGAFEAEVPKCVKKQK